MQNQISDDADLRDRFVPIVDTQIEGRKIYDYALEGLRGLAALWVAYSHIFFYEFKLDPAYHPTFSFGSLFNAAHGGILIFFALSGYVIGLTNQLPFTKSNAIRYLLRRFIRLYPIYNNCDYFRRTVFFHGLMENDRGQFVFLARWRIGIVIWQWSAVDFTL